MPLHISMALDVFSPLAKMPSPFFSNWWTTYSFKSIQLYLIAILPLSFYSTWHEFLLCNLIKLYFYYKQICF